MILALVKLTKNYAAHFYNSNTREASWTTLCETHRHRYRQTQKEIQSKYKPIQTKGVDTVSTSIRTLA